MIGGDLTYIQCTEFSLEEPSTYYQNAIHNKENIYYNPFQVFTTTDNEVYYNRYNEEVAKENVKGVIYSGELINNRVLLQNVFESENSLNSHKELLFNSANETAQNSRQITFPTTDPAGNRLVFSMHPMTYLEALGYTNVTADSYGTLEPTMDAAGAFNTMYSDFQLPAGLYNSNHCVLTAISNVLMYWGYRMCSLYPDTYDQMFTTVMNYAVQRGYFNNTAGASGVTGAYIDDILLGVNSLYTYSGDVYINSNQSLSFLKNHINEGRPIVLCFSSSGDHFAFGNHATVAFGYNVINGTKYNETFQYSFVKFFDGYNTYTNSYTGAGRGKVYVCWNMIVASEYYPYNPGAEVEYEDPITTYMVAFNP